MKTESTNRRRAGYSLVEVTLALLVVAIGMTATFALFPEGLKATRAAVNDTEVGLFADYVFSTLAATAAAQGLKEDLPDAVKADKYASRVLSDDHDEEKLLNSGNELSRFYWIARNMDMGTGNWDLTSQAGFWSSAFTYQLDWKKKNNGNNRDTYYAVLKVWPGEWEEIADEEKFPPYVFYREIVPYPDL
ncbi:MAG: prepilin-type N-terminal cleavage/methylation domain-containing protein [Kiritimatiellia bacterium]